MDLTTVRKALKELGLPTSTPGIKGDARRTELRQRLQAAMAPPPSLPSPSITMDTTMDTARSTTSTTSITSSSRRPPRSSSTNSTVTAATIAALKAALESRDQDTRTPGVRGHARKELLEQRLADAMYSNSNTIVGTNREDYGDSNDGNDGNDEEAPPPYTERCDRGSFTARADLTPSSSTKKVSRRTTAATTAATTTATSASTANTTNQEHRYRPASAPLRNDDGKRRVPSTARAPWAVRTRVGRGRGRSRGACRGVSVGSSRRSRGSSRTTSSGSKGTTKPASSSASSASTPPTPPAAASSPMRLPLTERTTYQRTEQPPQQQQQQHDMTPRGTRGQPPISARLTARLSSIENLYTEASEELRDATHEHHDALSEAQDCKETAASLRNQREAAVARQSDPSTNATLRALVDDLDDTRQKLKDLYKKGGRGGSGPTSVSMAFKELEALERSLDDEIDRLCSKIVLKEEKSTKHGIAAEENMNKEGEKCLVRAGRLKRMLPLLRDKEKMAKVRLDQEFSRRSALPPHPGKEAVQDPLKLAENAHFLWQIRDDVDTADRVFGQALSRAPDNAKILHLYATFLHQSTRRQHQTSARMWQRAVLLAPRDADILTSYGTLLHRVMCKADDALPLIRRALSVNPQHPMALLAHALLLQGKKNYEEAAQHFILARKSAPTELSIVTHYANFLKKCKADYKQCEDLFEKGMELHPCDPDHCGAYAQFMFKIKGNIDRAENLFQKAIDADPQHWHNLSRYANMCKKIGNYDQAESLYQNACNSSSNPTTCGNYANFLQLIRNDWERAQKFYLKALELDPSNQVVRKNYATFLRDHPEARVKRNESVVDQTPLAKALSRSNRNYQSPVKSSHKSLKKKVKTVTPKHTGLTPKRMKRKTPNVRPRKLAPELDILEEVTPRTEAHV